MKLTGSLKQQVEKAETREEAREAIAKAGMLLTDDELDQVSGGTGYVDLYPTSVRFYCDDCQKGFDVHLRDSKKRTNVNDVLNHCPRCGGTNTHKA